MVARADDRANEIQALQKEIRDLKRSLKRLKKKASEEFLVFQRVISSEQLMNYKLIEKLYHVSEIDDIRAALTRQEEDEKPNQRGPDE